MKIAWTLWFTGLHGAGKTTIARGLFEAFQKKGINIVMLDGDEVRKTISADLGYSTEDRIAHMKRVADVCKLINKSNVNVIACVASPTEQTREYAKKAIRNLLLVYVKCSLKKCESRDVKGHYKKARLGEKNFENFLGIGIQFEEPKNPDIILDTENSLPEKSVKELIAKLTEKGIFPK